MGDQDNGAGSDQSENAGQDTVNGSGAERTFSQEEVNKMIKGRSERELQKLLGEIGFQSVDELKTLVKKERERNDVHQQLAEKSEQLAAIERQNKFYDSAHAAGVKNLKLAWKAAEEFLGDDGEVDLNAMKKAYPELFSVPKLDATAGQGMQNQPQALSMNDIIRRAAGRQ